MPPWSCDYILLKDTKHAAGQPGAFCTPSSGRCWGAKEERGGISHVYVAGGLRYPSPASQPPTSFLFLFLTRWWSVVIDHMSRREEKKPSRAQRETLTAWQLGAKQEDIDDPSRLVPLSRCLHIYLCDCFISSSLLLQYQHVEGATKAGRFFRAQLRKR